MKKRASKVLMVCCTLLLTYVFTGCGLFTKTEYSFTVLIPSAEKEASPVRYLKGAEIEKLTFATNKNDDIESQLWELLEITANQKKAPDFANSDVSVDVKDSYDKAVAVLNRYIKNNYTEFERVLAIHDYLSYYIKYDYNLYERYLQNPLFEPSEVERMSFELTGVFLSARTAVCDGLSKAFMLLCAIEGIESRYVVGTYDDGYNCIPHAWNKVKIGENWYNVDITMDNFLFKVKEVDYRVLNHGFFLRSDRVYENYGGHTEARAEEQRWIVPAAEKEYDFYKDHTFPGIENCPTRATNAEELKDIFKKVQSENRRVGAIEVQLDFYPHDEDMANRLSNYADAIQKAYRAVSNASFSYTPSGTSAPPFAQYPGGVFVFMIYV